MVAGKRKSEDDNNALAGTSLSVPEYPMPKAKRQKKASNAVAESQTPQQEKRLARFKSSCPKNIMERMDRVMTQRFFMIDRKREGNEPREEFRVLGSTGNVYTVLIDKLPSCNCPDATKGNHCKHILFIFLKVLSVSISSNLFYQKALLPTELEAIFSKAPIAPNSLSHPRVQAAYAEAMGRTEEATALKSKANEGDQKKQRIPKEEDDCPICYETMFEVETKSLTFCDQCGNALHNECFQQWARSATLLTCVWCRAKWSVVADMASASSSTSAHVSEGYLNLGAAAGLSPVRDTSSYYDGPRRREPWYYRRY